MNFENIVGSVVDRGKSFFDGISSKVDTFKGVLGGISINEPNLGLDVNKITSTITEGSNIDPNKMMESVSMPNIDTSNIPSVAADSYDMSSIGETPSLEDMIPDLKQYML